MTPANASKVSPSQPPASSRMLVAALAIIALVASVALPGWGIAADTRSGSDIAIGASEIIADDLYLAAGTVTFEGTARREVAIAAGEATVSGPIGGSLSLAAGTVTVSSDIEGSLRILGGRVELRGDVGGDVVIVGGTLTITGSSTIGGNIIAAGGQLEMNGQVGGDLQGYVATASIGGSIAGSVDVWTNDLDITGAARITGPITQTGRSEADIASAAQTPGGFTHQGLNPWGDGDNPLSRASGAMLRTLWMLVAGLLIVTVAPRLANQLGTNGKRLVPALALGLLALLVLPVIGVVLMITVIGIPAGLMMLALYLMALYLTQAVVGMTLGRFILPTSWNDGSRGFHLLAMTLGVLIVTAFRFVPLPWVWEVVQLAVTIWGIGAILMLIPVLNRQERAGV